jgi:hypothetical protein
LKEDKHVTLNQGFKGKGPGGSASFKPYVSKKDKLKAKALEYLGIKKN